MCTLILAWRVFEGTPVVAAANRDELLGRPARPPGVLDESPRVVAPQDEQAGGTWIGYNDAGLFVAVTNRSADIEGERSRGLLVRDALARRSTDAALAFVRDELATREYAGFNLALADDESAVLLEWDGVLRTTDLDPGVHAVVNEGLNDADPKAARIRAAVATEPGESLDAWFERAKRTLQDHDIEACVHADGYGTRSSSLVTVDADGNGTYRFADGPPCETEYREIRIGQV